MLWLRLVLTHETDRLAVIAGIVRCLQPPLNCKYVAGLWDYQVELQFLWSRICGWTRSSTYKTPTWSWASSPGLLHYAPDALGDISSELFKFSALKLSLRPIMTVALVIMAVFAKSGLHSIQIGPV
jgi:hypothetical protein